MRIQINRKQYYFLKEAIGKEVEGSKTSVIIAAGIKRSLSGIFNDIDLFYRNLSRIKDGATLKMVIDILGEEGFRKNFYDLINQKLDGEQKNKTVKILNSNNLPHKIIDNKIVPTSIEKKIVTTDKKVTQTKIKEPKPVIEKPKKETLTDKLKNDLKFRREVVAATLIGEASNQGSEGMKAVYSVLYNRTKTKEFGDAKTMAEQALYKKPGAKQYQFSMWDGKGDSLSKIESEIERYKKDSNWDFAYSLTSKLPVDNTKGATHYYNPDETIETNHPWIGSMKVTKKIKNHIFGIA